MSSPSLPSPPTSPLSPDLVARYHAWLKNKFQPNKTAYAKLAKAQTPTALVISCCDSRVNAMSLFSASDGDFFIHRNIANLVPPYASGDSHQGTFSAIEYAVKVLQVAHILVIGHAGCGGIAAAHSACQAKAAQQKLEADLPYVSAWLGMLAPVYARLPESLQKEASQDALMVLEQTSIINSLNNLAEFPFVAAAMAGEQLSISGLWHDIGEGRLYVYDATSQKFQPI